MQEAIDRRFRSGGDFRQETSDRKFYTEGFRVQRRSRQETSDRRFATRGLRDEIPAP
jgi:hypothetical protein